jgi:hypothetical protein
MFGRHVAGRDTADCVNSLTTWILAPIRVKLPSNRAEVPNGVPAVTAAHGVGGQMFRERRERLAVRRRAGRSTLRMLRGEAWREGRKEWRRLTIFLVCWIAATVLVAALQQTSFLRGLFVGLMIGLLGFFLMVFLVATGIAHRQMGGAAEQWTGEVLERLDRGRWYVIHDVHFEVCNIDHVPVGPRRVYAVETKWTTWGGEPKFLRGAAACAKKGATKLRSLLASVGLKREVIPLLVVWGPGTEAMPRDASWEDGVGIVAGVHGALAA